jgi:hypothetical protein
MVQNALDDLGLRDDAQDAQRAPTSRALRTSTAKTRSSEKAERLDEGLGCINQVLDFDSGSPRVSNSANSKHLRL